MNRALVDRIADAVLYEGYILYPYRPAVKNQHRWTFGGIVPRAYSEAHAGSDPWSMQTECLIRGSGRTTLGVKVRFLHVLERTTRDGALPGPAWQEAVERVVDAPDLILGELVDRPHLLPFAFPPSEVVDEFVRRQEGIEGVVDISAQPLREGGFKLTVRMVNLTPLEAAEQVSRDEAMLRAFASTHTILTSREGQFLSLTDPPEDWRDAAGGCRNLGCWPVLVGEEGQTDTMLSSPIILSDYPQVAPESPGDFFDGTEIDEMLTLRILTLTEEEKRQMADTDERTRELLARTEALAREQLLSLHGTIRGLRPVKEGGRD
jgi:hydrogenase maturation protease